MRHGREVGGQPGARIAVQAEAAIVAAQQHRDQGSAIGREAIPPGLRLRCQALRSHPMQRGAGDENIRPGQFVMVIGDDEVETVDVHPRILHLHHPHGLAPQRRQHGRGHAAAADRQGWQRRAHGIGDSDQRVRPQLGRHPLPRRARLEFPEFDRKPGGFGQTERLGA